MNAELELTDFAWKRKFSQPSGGDDRYAEIRHLKRELTQAAFERLAADMDMGAEQIGALASAAFDISIAKMSGAVREVSVYRGFDPRGFSLVAFGGAGPMHALFVADELGIDVVVVPRLPGHFSALGQIMAGYRGDFVMPWNGRVSTMQIADAYAVGDQLLAQGNRYLDGESVQPEFRSMTFSADTRYSEQSFTLSVAWNPWEEDFDGLRQSFARQHEETFGYVDHDNDVEVTAMRVSARGSDEGSRNLDLVNVNDSNAASGGDMLLERRQVWFGDTWHDCPVYLRERIAPSLRIAGPAVIEEFGGTTVVPPGWEVEVHASGALLCRSEQSDRVEASGLFESPRRCQP